MKINDRNMPGPGDPETWPPYSGHPLDPRAPLEYEPSQEEMESVALEEMADDYIVLELFERIMKDDNDKDIGIINDVLCDGLSLTSLEYAVCKFKELIAHHAINYYGEESVVEMATKVAEDKAEADREEYEVTKAEMYHDD